MEGGVYGLYSAPDAEVRRHMTRQGCRDWSVFTEHQEVTRRSVADLCILLHGGHFGAQLLSLKGGETVERPFKGIKSHDSRNPEMYFF